jgi:hypothetical protein
MRAPRLALVFPWLAVAGLWIACSSSSGSSATSGPADGGDDGGDATVFDSGNACNPCIQVCPCNPGDTTPVPGSCKVITCPPSGMWGGQGECLGQGCPEAGDDADATSGDAEPEGGSDGAQDGTSEGAASDGATEGGHDGSSDGARDGAADGTAD